MRSRFNPISESQRGAKMFEKMTAPSLRSSHDDGGASKRLLLVAALLAGEFHPRAAFLRRDAIWRAAFAASRLDAGIALLNDNGLARHGFADQALGLFPHRLLRHSPAPVMETATDAALYTRSASGDQPCCEKTASEAASLFGSIRIQFRQLLLRDFQIRLHPQWRTSFARASRTNRF